MTPEQWQQMTRAQKSAHVARYGPPPPEWAATPDRLAQAPSAAPQVIVVAPKRRRIWPWVLLALVLIPVLVFAGCAVLVGGAVKSVDDARLGGTAKLGDTFTYASGLALSVTPPEPYQATNPYIVGRDETGYEVTVTVRNGTDAPVGSILISTNVTVNQAPAERVFDGVDLPNQDIAPGQELREPIRFKVKKGATGPMQVAVTDTFNQPVFFTGTLS